MRKTTICSVTGSYRCTCTIVWIRMLLTHDRAKQKTELEAAKPFAEKLRRYMLRDPRPGAPNGLVAMGLEPILIAYEKKLES